MKQQLESIANELLQKEGVKPNYSNRDFMNAVIIFQTALMDKMYDLQENEQIDSENRLLMANDCGQKLRKLIHTYTGLDTHKIEDFI